MAKCSPEAIEIIRCQHDGALDDWTDERVSKLAITQQTDLRLSIGALGQAMYDAMPGPLKRIPQSTARLLLANIVLALIAIEILAR